MAEVPEQQAVDLATAALAVAAVATAAIATLEMVALTADLVGQRQKVAIHPAEVKEVVRDALGTPFYMLAAVAVALPIVRPAVLAALAAAVLAEIMDHTEHSRTQMMEKQTPEVAVVA